MVYRLKGAPTDNCDLEVSAEFGLTVFSESLNLSFPKLRNWKLGNKKWKRNPFRGSHILLFKDGSYERRVRTDAEQLVMLSFHLVICLYNKLLVVYTVLQLRKRSQSSKKSRN